jgi:GTPase
LSSFEEIDSQLHYQQALSVVEHLLDKADLTARERSGLEAELKGLAVLRQKLDQGVIQIAVCGLVGRGKSSLLNALVGQAIFATGPLHGVTRQAQGVQWQVAQEALSADASLYRATIQRQESPESPDLTASQRVELLDTPGLDEVAGEIRQKMAEQVAQRADLILFVVTGDLTQIEFDALSQLRQANKAILLVLNKVDQYPPGDRAAIMDKLAQQVGSLQILPVDIVQAAASPLLTKINQQEGQRRLERYRGQAQVDALKLKMLDVLERDGKALLALNSLLYADSVQIQLVERKLEIRQHSAEEIIWRATLIKAFAVALNPIMLTDLLGGAAVDIVMILALSRLYGIAMTQQGALQLLKTIALAMGGLSATELLTTFGLSSLKSLLGLSTVATGGLTLSPYAAVALTQATVAGVSTYVLGTVTQHYLAQGASWGKGGARVAIATLLVDLDEDSIVSRLKQTLKERLNLPGEKP